MGKITQTFSASAPGRLDVMGGIADYSGSLVLQMPVRNRTIVSISLREDFQCHLNSHLNEGSFEADFNYKELLGVDFATAREILNKKKETSWIAYVLGCVFVLERENKIEFTGADFNIESNVPLGKGVSSSAAIEVATMKAMAQAFHIEFQGTELAVLAQRVENTIVGAPCGLMDQLASCFAPAGELLPIVCQPDILRGPIRIPDAIRFLGLDSGVRHSVADASYRDVRCAAFMGYSIIAQCLGIHYTQIRNAREYGNLTDLPFNGYLCNIVVDEFENKFKSILPEKISGADFIAKYKSTTDSMTSINPLTTYSVLNCTSHPIYENERVLNFMSLISNLHPEESQVRQMGDLMHQSHESYTRCGLGSDGTDKIVELAKSYSSQGIYGAKITGGGAGGTVCLLTVGEEGFQSAKEIHRIMEESTKSKLEFFD